MSAKLVEGIRAREAARKAARVVVVKPAKKAKAEKTVERVGEMITLAEAEQ